MGFSSIKLVFDKPTLLEKPYFITLFLAKVLLNDLFESLFFRRRGRTIIQDLPHLRIPLRRADNASVFHHIHQACRARIADSHPALQHRNRSATLAPDNINRIVEKRIVGRDGKAVGIELIKCSRVFDENRRFNPQFIEGSEALVDCDTVVMAVGQAADLSWIKPEDNLKLSPRGRLQTDPASVLRDQFPHVHRLHSRRADGCQAKLGVLVASAQFRLDADPFRGFQKNVRRGLLMLHHLARHHGFEQMQDFQVFEHLADD